MAPLALLGALARSACENVFDHHTAPIFSIASSECLWVRSGCFSNLASSESAAIFLFYVTGSVTVERTFFLSCSASTYGGACSFVGPSSVLSHCCASNCSGDQGHFCYFSLAAVSLSETALFACADTARPPLPATGSYGAILFDLLPTNASCWALNFTKCIAMRASAIEFSSGSTAANCTSLSFFSVVDCEGASSIALTSSSGSGGYPFHWFSFGNLYQNNCSSAVFTLSSSSVTIQRCVFFANTRDITGTASANSTLIGCVFSLALPSVSGLSSTSNAALHTTQSIAIGLSLLYRCPLSICPTWSFSNSHQFPASTGMKADPSVHFVSDWIRSSLTFRLTVAFPSSSAAFDPSQRIGSSASPSSSAAFDPSQRIGGSLPCSPSRVHANSVWLSSPLPSTASIKGTTSASGSQALLPSDSFFCSSEFVRAPSDSGADFGAGVSRELIAGVTLAGFAIAAAAAAVVIAWRHRICARAVSSGSQDTCTGAQSLLTKSLITPSVDEPETLGQDSAFWCFSQDFAATVEPLPDASL
jgi:hypothetical protein